MLIFCLNTPFVFYKIRFYSIVMFVFEQCLLCFAYHPDVWYDAASYLENTGRDLIERGVSPFHLLKTRMLFILLFLILK